MALVLLYGPSPGYYDHRLLRSLWAVGHAVFFAALTLVLLRWFLRPAIQHPRRVLGIVLSILAVAAVASEAGQLWTPHRQAGINDLLQNLLGIALGLMLSPHALALLPRRHTEISVLLALPICSGLALLPWITLADTLHARQQFPVLLAMESPFEVTRLGGTQRRAWVREDRHGGVGMLELAFEPPSSGFGMRHFPPDWRDFRELQIHIHSDNPLPVTLRIHDRKHEEGPQLYHDRYNQRFELNPGWQVLRVPLESVADAPRNRPMNMSAISGVGFFNSSLERPGMLRIGEVRLVPHD